MIHQEYLKGHLGPLRFTSDINSVNLSHESKLLPYTDESLLYWSITSGNDYKLNSCNKTLTFLMPGAMQTFSL